MHLMKRLFYAASATSHQSNEPFFVRNGWSVDIGWLLLMMSRARSFFRKPKKNSIINQNESHNDKNQSFQFFTTKFSLAINRLFWNLCLYLLSRVNQSYIFGDTFVQRRERREMERSFFGRVFCFSPRKWRKQNESWPFLMIVQIGRWQNRKRSKTNHKHCTNDNCQCTQTNKVYITYIRIHTQ